ncbi:MAG: hypothetical protein ABSA18_10830 [Dehalococcoidia bacterium]|jgi:hypothetical protein
MANKVEIRADIVKNRLYMHIQGFFPDDEARKIADIGIAEASKLKPGFDIVNNITGFKPTSPKGAEEIKRALIFVKQHGARRIIRVTGEAVISEAQFSRQSKDLNMHVDTASTVADADRILDGK